MEKAELIKRIAEEEDYIRAPKYGNSLQKYLAKNDKIPDNKVIGKLLLISSEQVEEIYQDAVIKLREDMSDEDNSD